MGSQTTHPLMVIDLTGICIILSCLLGPSNGEHFQVRTKKMPYLTNAEENELKRLKTTTDVGILGDV